MTLNTETGRCVRLLTLAILVVSVCVPAADAAQDEYSRAREQFIQAYAAADSRTATSQPMVAADSEALRKYPLYPYLQAARIRRDLLTAVAPDTRADTAAIAFLAQFDRDPVSRDVRRTLLLSLAERSEWQTYLDQYRDQSADGVLRCNHLVARLELKQTEGLAAEISKQWLTPVSLPNCEPAFVWLRVQGALSDELTEQRARLALDKGNTKFARQIIAFLPQPRQAPLLQWASLIDNPQFIDAFIGDPQRAVEPTLLLTAWQRFARKDRDGAIARYGQLVASRKLSDAEASPYALALALPLAWDRRPEALDYFKRVKASDFDDVAYEWQTRAALWARDWSLVSRSIATMPNAQRETARWRYWSARAAEHLQDPQLARRLYESVIIDDNYYSAMAAARLERTVTPHPEQVAVDKAQLNEIEQLPGLIRARELYWSHLRHLAQVEWMVGFESLSQPARAQAIHLAHNWGWYDQAVATASQLRLYNDYALLYPQPYDHEVRVAANLTQLPQILIYGVLRQESLYRADAVSSAGARGLLQLLPETARRTAQIWKRPKPSNTQLLEPAINVPLGAAQLRTLMDRFEGQTPVALAGYNAGPGAARRWLPEAPIDSDIWIENIPYNETRAYVQRILWHTVVFGWLQSGKAQSADQWIARISPVEKAT